MSFEPIVSATPASIPVSDLLGYLLGRDVPGLETLTVDIRRANGGFIVENQSTMTSVDAPNLMEVSGDLDWRNCPSFLISSNQALTDISGFPALTSVSGYFAITSNPYMQGISGFPALTSVGGFWVYDNFYLASISGFSALASADYIDIRYNQALTDITTGFSALSSVGSVTLSSNSLNAASVNFILAKLVTCTGVDKVTPWRNTCNLSSGDNAAPSGQGVTDKATLIARGATVTTN